MTAQTYIIHIENFKLKAHYEGFKWGGKGFWYWGLNI